MNRLADPYRRDSLSGRARDRRWRWLADTFPELPAMRVLDLGGRAENWEAAPVLPREVVLLNLETSTTPAAKPFTRINGDALSPPPDIGQFDLVYSNSVIEHLGGYTQRRMFADTVKRFAPWHWVQTPYRYFPLEPHWLFPGFQSMPLAAKAFICQRWTLGHRQSVDQLTAVEQALEVELLSKTEMRHLFGASSIIVERVLGLPKSLIAVRAP